MYMKPQLADDCRGVNHYHALPNILVIVMRHEL